MTTIQHASSSEVFAERLRDAVSAADGTTVLSSPTAFESGDIGTIVAELIQGQPDLVVVGPDSDLDIALHVAEQLDAEHPEISVVLVAVPSASVLERAMHAGTRGVLSPDAAQAEIESVVTRAITVAQRRRELVMPVVETGPKNRVIPILAAKGGSGKTTVSTNLAVSLAREYPGDVVIVDLDVQFGDVASAFGLEPMHTFADIARHPGPIDITRLKTLLTPKQSAGLYVLAAPDSPAEADDLEPKMVADIVRLLATEFPYVIVDTSAGIDEFTLEVLDLASDLVLLASMDVPSVRAVSKEIDALEMLGLRNADWHLVLNRASSKVGLTIEDVEATLGRQIDVRIPSSRSVPLSVNRGVPISIQERKSPVGRAFEELARRTAHAEAKGSSWLKGRLAQ
jgi:pilus assembly protein CpaE